ncbi:MAG TPA: hypothetical protein VHH34_11555 [Pseudonocardiaceae bacterium]|nr:hypothetical protein [Pseudonocardiaceae bacterium]
MATITITAIGIFCALPVFWYLPPLILTGAGAAVGTALINSLGNASGFVAPYLTGWLDDTTGNQRTGLWFVGIAMLAAAIGALLLARAATRTETRRVADEL